MEQWRNIPGTNGLYQISIDTKEGLCRSLYNGKPRVLSNNLRKGRIFWRIRGKYWQAARWIAITYPELVCNDYFEGAEIDHIDTDPNNNNPSNLRWTDRSGQMKNKLTRQHLKTSNTNNKKISKQVAQMTDDGDIIAVYPSTKEAERQTGISSSSISRCCNGILYKHSGGYRWQWR